MKKKLKLEELEVASFVTSIEEKDKQTLAGGLYVPNESKQKVLGHCYVIVPVKSDLGVGGDCYTLLDVDLLLGW